MILLGLVVVRSCQITRMCLRKIHMMTSNNDIYGCSVFSFTINSMITCDGTTNGAGDCKFMSFLNL